MCCLCRRCIGFIWFTNNLMCSFVCHRKLLTWQKTSWTRSRKVHPPPMAQIQYLSSTAGRLGIGVWLSGVRTASEYHCLYIWSAIQMILLFCIVCVWFFFLFIILIIEFYCKISMMSLIYFSSMICDKNCQCQVKKKWSNKSKMCLVCFISRAWVFGSYSPAYRLDSLAGFTRLRLRR